MKNVLVLGCGFGDEGKGKVVDWLCSLNEPTTTLVTRYSGSSQCGHGVKLPNGVEHIFSSVGSGTLRGAQTYIDKGVYFNPIKFLNEIDVLKKKCELNHIFIHKDTPLVTPFEVFESRDPNSREMVDGTCGQGVFQTLRRENHHFHLRAMDLWFPNVLIEKLKLIKSTYYSQSNFDVVLDLILWETVCKECQKVLKLVFDDSTTLNNSFETQIWESNQGLLLDEYIGFMPNCTPTPILPQKHDFDECYLVTRSYHTRHGNGVFPVHYELKDDRATKKFENKFEDNITNEYQGNFRTGYLNINLLQYALLSLPHNLSKKYFLVINHLDIEDSTCIFDGKLMDFRTKDNFIEFIKNHCGILNISNVYIGQSPYSTDIGMWKPLY
jgi:adenylosuccinate synthase